MKGITFINICPFDFKAAKDCEYCYNRLDHDGSRWYNHRTRVNGTGGIITITDDIFKISDYVTDVLVPDGLIDIDKLIQTGAVEHTADLRKLICMPG